jgi:hypothetical protein
MRGLASTSAIFGLLLTAGCSSESLTQGEPTPSSPSSPTGTTTAPGAVDGNFAPLQAYPPGPYGHGLGAVIENLEFLGWRDPVGIDYDPSVLESIHLGDYYDPAGTDTELIVLNAAAVWCTVCQSEMHDMYKNGTYDTFRDRKVQVFGTLFQDIDGNPAKPSDLVIWGSSAVRQIAFPLVLDPALKMGIYFTSDATPLNLVIDARTMRIIGVMMGYSSDPRTGLWATVDQELKSRGL